MAKQTLSVLVENHPGVLLRVSGLFSKRAFNIHSITAGETDDPEVTRMTIVVDGDEHIVDQVYKQLMKLIEVKKVKKLMDKSSVKRELALIKVNTSVEQRAQVIQIADVFRANIVDITHSTMTVEVSGTEEKIDAIIDMLKYYGIVEISKTGITAVERGKGNIND